MRGQEIGTTINKSEKFRIVDKIPRGQKIFGLEASVGTSYYEHGVLTYARIVKPKGSATRNNNRSQKAKRQEQQRAGFKSPRLRSW